MRAKKGGEMDQVSTLALCVGSVVAHARYPVMAHFQGGGIKSTPNRRNENIKGYERGRDGN